MCITIIFMYVDGIISNIYFLDSMEDDDLSDDDDDDDDDEEEDDEEDGVNSSGPKCKRLKQ